MNMLSKYTITFLIIMWSKNGRVFNAESSASGSNEIERFENIVKSELDKRSYRGLKLRNNLKAFLISDPSTAKSAACMTVGAGALNDFHDLPGLASLVGYLLIKGKKRHNSELGFKDFLEAHDGYTDDFPKTDVHGEVFRFDVGSDYFALALERFAEIFLVPGLEDLTFMELYDAINEMQLKHENSKANDDLRIALVEKSFCKKNHPFGHKFFGNREALFWNPVKKVVKESEFEISEKSYPELLKTTLHPKVMQFHSMWYSSNVMSLAVLGKESLDELEAMVVRLFENVENRDAKKMVYPFKFHPLGPEQLGREIYIVIESDAHILRLMFPTPDFSHRYRTNPADYVSYLIEHQGPTSLISVLRKQDLCTDLKTMYEVAAGLAFYFIQFELTTLGLDRHYVIVSLLFEYIEVLRITGVEEWIFKENNRLDEIEFLFKKNETSPLSYVHAVSSSMHNNYPMQDILSHSYLRDKWDPSLISEFLSYFIPENMNFSVISKVFKSVAVMREKWYQTPYTFKKISATMIKLWNEHELATVFDPPTRNEFIPQSFALYPVEENEITEPYVVYESSVSKFWFKQDTKFRIPELHVRFEIFCPSLRWDPLKRFLYYLFGCSVMDFMESQYSGNANVAGLKWKLDLQPVDLKFMIHVWGYDDKMMVILKKLASVIMKVADNVKEEIFTRSKQEYITYWELFKMNSASFQVRWYRSQILSESYWSVEEILNGIKVLQFKDWRKFIRKIFSRVFIQGLIFGNLNKKKAEQIARMIEEPFKRSCGLLQQEILPMRSIQMNEGVQYLYTAYNARSNEYLYSVYFQFSPESMVYDIVDVLGVLFLLIVAEKCETILPHEEGRTVDRTLILKNGSGGILITLSSEKHRPTYIDLHVENFLQDVHEILKNLTVEDFEEWKRNLITKELAEASTLDKLVDLYWKQIRERVYGFEEREVVIDYLRLIQKRDLLIFFEEILQKSSPERRKLAIYVLPQRRRNKDERNRSGAVRIKDFTALKSASSLLPIATPYIDTEPLGIRS